MEKVEKMEKMEMKGEKMEVRFFITKHIRFIYYYFKIINNYLNKRIKWWV